MKKLFIFFVVALISVSSNVVSAPVSYTLFQYAYAEGAFIRVSFTGEDFDNDGQLVSFGGLLNSVQSSADWESQTISGGSRDNCIQPVFFRQFSGGRIYVGFDQLGWFCL